MSNSLRPSGLQLIRFLCPWHSPGRNTGVGCHFLLPNFPPRSIIWSLYFRALKYQNASCQWTMQLELSCVKKEKSKLAQVWRRLPQKGRVVPVKQNEERVGRVWFCVEGRRPGHSGLPQQEKKARPSTVHRFFATIGKLSPGEPKQPGLQEDGSPGRFRMCDPRVTEPRKDAATTTRCRRIATQRPTNHNDLQLQA